MGKAPDLKKYKELQTEYIPRIQAGQVGKSTILISFLNHANDARK
jgi:hypothetical protein